MEKVAPNSNLLGILLKIIRQSKIKGTLILELSKWYCVLLTDAYIISNIKTKNNYKRKRVTDFFDLVV